MSEGVPPKVFISYSWTSSKEVLEIAERLMSNGIDVVLDKWELKEGQDKYAFMEKCVNDTEVDKVLIMCDKSYKEKANARKSGVGDEAMIISSEVYGKTAQEKFIPIILEKDENGEAYTPTFIKSRIYIDLSGTNEQYEDSFEILLRNLYEKPLYRKPAVGKMPEWLNDDRRDYSTLRNILKQLKNDNGNNAVKSDYLLEKCKDEFIKVYLEIPTDENLSYDEDLLKRIDESKSIRDIFLDYLDTIMYRGYCFGDILPEFFEKLYNETHNAVGKNSYGESEFELYDFIIYELFICSTAFLLQYERFDELRALLSHSYFLRKHFTTNDLEYCNYTNFRKYCTIIEEVCKKKCEHPNYYSYTSVILLRREKKHLITESSLVNADVFLYQMAYALSLDEQGIFSRWFPNTHYCCRYGYTQAIWKKLKSKKYCEKIMPLFGVKEINELKMIIEKVNSKQPLRFNNGFDNAPNIYQSIKTEDIATVN